jgi:hypothetical protein
MTSLGHVAAAFYLDMNEARSNDHLITIERSIWREWGEKRIPDAEAQFLSDAIAKMKTTGQTARAVGSVVSGLGSRFVSRQRPRSPDRAASRARRRQLGGSGALPDPLRQSYTEGQRAVLCVIAGEVKKAGRCDLPIDKIGALAGVGRTTVQTTLHEARRLGHIRVQERPQRGRKSLTNVIEILSREWLAWIKRGPRRSVSDRVQTVHGDQNSERHEERRIIVEGRSAQECSVLCSSSYYHTSTAGARMVHRLSTGAF